MSWSILPLKSATQERTHVLFRQTFNRKPHIDPEIEESIEQNWRTQVEKNPKLFNATKFRLKECVECSDGIQLRLGLTDYKTYLGSCQSPLRDEFLQCGRQQYGCEFACVSRKLGVSGIVCTSNDCVVFLQRSQHVGVHQGLMDVPGGHPEPKNIGITMETLKDSDACDQLEDAILSELCNSILAEIHEEVNIPLQSLSKPILKGIVYQMESHTPTLAYIIHCDLDSTQVQEFYAQGPKEAFESTRLVFLPIASANAINSETAEQYTPAARGCLQLFNKSFD